MLIASITYETTTENSKHKVLSATKPNTFAEKVFGMADFRSYAPLLHRLEKGFSDDKDDKGGATMDGVTLTTYRRFYGDSLTVKDLKRMTKTQWNHIMKTGYWDACKADQINNQSVAEIIADWCVNSGTARIREVQAIAGVKPDGVVGPKTLAAINGADQRVLFYRIRMAREQWYHKRVQIDPTQRKFLNGWMNRLDAFSFTA